MTVWEMRIANRRLIGVCVFFNAHMNAARLEEDKVRTRLFIAERAAMRPHRKQATMAYLSWKDNNPTAAWAIRDKHISKEWMWHFKTYKTTNIRL